jgi:hypothetical protein
LDRDAVDRAAEAETDAFHRVAALRSIDVFELRTAYQKWREEREEKRKAREARAVARQPKL